jgi:hypothetical protein
MFCALNKKNLMLLFFFRKGMELLLLKWDQRMRVHESKEQRKTKDKGTNKNKTKKGGTM